MSIGDFARAAGLTPKALRLYDEIDLVIPAEVDDVTGYRYYVPDQLDRARLVARLRLAGISLERIRVLIDLPSADRATALRDYWRQAEADHVSRRGLIADLVDNLPTKETQMMLTHPLAPAIGQRAGKGQRDRQLDAVTIGSRVFAVADGFGDHDELSARALEAMRQIDTVTGAVDPVALLDEAVAAAGAAATVTGRPDRDGCTLTALVLGDDCAAVAHIGDSRAYRVRDGRLEQLTRDHTLVQLLVEEGRLTPEEARSHADRPLLNRAIEPGAVPEADISVVAVRDGDRFVLTTDGVHAALPIRRLAELAAAEGTADEVAGRIEADVEAAGAPDNYAVIVIDVPLEHLPAPR